MPHFQPSRIAGCNVWTALYTCDIVLNSDGYVKVKVVVQSSVEELSSLASFSLSSTLVLSGLLESCWKHCPSLLPILYTYFKVHEIIFNQPRNKTTEVLALCSSYSQCKDA